VAEGLPGLNKAHNVGIEAIDKQVELDQATIWIGEDGIARYVASPDAEITQGDAEETHEAVQDLYGGDSYPLLVDIRGVKSASREARKFFAGTHSSKTTRAVGLLVASPVSRMIGTFFIRLSKPYFPARLFTREAEAVAWLRSFVE
jgi:hypothetical protein